MWKPIPYGILQTCTTTQLGCVPIRALDGSGGDSQVEALGQGGGRTLGFSKISPGSRPGTFESMRGYTLW